MEGVDENNDILVDKLLEGAVDDTVYLNAEMLKREQVIFDYFDYEVGASKELFKPRRCVLPP